MLIIEYLLGIFYSCLKLGSTMLILIDRQVQGGFDLLIIGAHADFWFALVCKRLGARECVFFTPVASVLGVSNYVWLVIFTPVASVLGVSPYMYTCTCTYLGKRAQGC